MLLQGDLSDGRQILPLPLAAMPGLHFVDQRLDPGICRCDIVPTERIQVSSEYRRA
jgi:hypothetical protein